MKTFNGQFYPTYFAFPREATLLIADQLVSVGYHTEQGEPVRLDWKIKEVKGDFLPGEHCSQFIHVPSQAECRIKGQEAADYWKEIIKEYQSPWYLKKRTGNLRRTAGLLAALLAIGLLIYFFLVPFIAEQMATVVSKKTERQLGDGIYDSMQSTQVEDTAASKIVNGEIANQSIDGCRKTSVGSNISYLLGLTIVGRSDSPVALPFPMLGLVNQMLVGAQNQAQ